MIVPSLIEADINALEEFITRTTGILLSKQQNDALTKFLTEKAALLGIREFRNYIKKIKTTTDGLDPIIGLITNHETYFFRESEHLRLFVDRLVPGFIKRLSPGETINVFSAGCSTGAEAYSMAIMLAEAYGNDIMRLVKITGADIDKTVIAVARQAKYGRYSFRGFEAKLIEKYFEKADLGRFQLTKNIRRMAEFMQINLAAENYPMAMNPFDCILYRNVSLYFDERNRRKVFTRLSGLLKPNGLIIMSPAEVPHHKHGILNFKEIGGLYVFVNEPVEVNKAPAVHLHPDKKPVPKPEPGKSKTHRHAQKTIAKAAAPACGLEIKSPEKTIEDAHAYALENQYDRAFAIIECLISKDSLNIRAHILRAGIMLNAGSYLEALKACGMALAADPLNFEACYLSGLAAKAAGHHDEAEKFFRQGIYADQNSWQAHYSLAEIYRAKGKKDAAIISYKTAIMHIEKSFDKYQDALFLKVPFTAAQMSDICQKAINALERTKK